MISTPNTPDDEIIDYDENYDHFTNTLKLVHDGVKKFGVKKFNKTLVSVIVSNDFSINKNLEKIDLIISCVLDEFKAYRITKDDIFESKKRGETTLARKMIVLIIKNNIDISNHKLASFFGGRCRQVVYKIIREYTKLDAQNKLDKKFIERYKNIDEKIKQKLILFSNIE